MTEREAFLIDCAYLLDMLEREPVLSDDPGYLAGRREAIGFLRGLLERPGVAA